jgi:hypothetical protein
MLAMRQHIDGLAFVLAERHQLVGHGDGFGSGR